MPLVLINSAQLTEGPQNQLMNACRLVCMLMRKSELEIRSWELLQGGESLLLLQTGNGPLSLSGAGGTSSDLRSAMFGLVSERPNETRSLESLHHTNP